MVKEQSKNHVQPSRREFFHLLVLLSPHNILSDFVALPCVETGKRVQAQVLRQDVNLQVTPNSNREVQRINEAWKNFEEHEVLTPGAIEGVFTLFGPASIAIKQLEVYAQTYRQSQEPLLPYQQQLIEIDDQVKKHLAGYDYSNSEQARLYAEGFMEILRSFGYEGVIALKAPGDFGRNGYLEVYDHVSEQWSAPQRVLVLNTSTYQTFKGKDSSLMNLQSVLPNHEVTMRWVAEICYELLYQKNLSIYVDHQNSGFIRAVINHHDEELSEQLVINFPDYAQAEKPFALGPSFHQFALELSVLLNSAEYSEILKIVEKLVSQPEFEIQVQGVLQNIHISTENSTSHILNRLGVPIFLDGNADTINQIMMLGSDNIGLQENAIPVGNHSLWTMCKNLVNAGVWQKKMIVSGKREDDILDIKTGIYFVEDFVNNTVHPVEIISQGIFSASEKSPFISLFDGQTQVLSTYEILQTITEPQQRLVIYHP